MRKLSNFVCKNCNTDFQSHYKDAKFCCRNCAAKYNNSKRTGISDEQKEKISNSLKKYYASNPVNQSCGDKHSKAVGNSTKGKYNKNPESLLELSKRTISKIIKRLNIGCSYCGWNEWVGHIHHIDGRKIPDADNHNNLSYLCPNCHTLAQAGIIPKNKLTTVAQQIGDSWKDCYYG